MPKLTVVATPIGNLGDFTDRAKRGLVEADVWFVEDSRLSGKLQAVLETNKPMRVLNEHTSNHRVEEYAQDIADGLDAAILTDAGTPCISDPGAHLVDLCQGMGIEIAAAPGVSAVTTALMLSGFYAQRFAFLGFLPRKAGAIRQELQQFIDSTYTLVLFESPNRIDKVIPVLADVLGNRRYAICRELTKIHEQVWRSRLDRLPKEEEVPRKGEFTLVIEGRRRGLETSDDRG